MTLSPALLLIVYCLAIALVSVGGGLLPDLVRLTHTRTQLVMSLVAGLMLGVAFYHLLPHSIVMGGGAGAADLAVWWLMLGLIAMFMLLRMFHFHQHDFSAEEDDHHDYPHSHHGGHVVHRLSWAGVAMGLAVHTVIDGLALGAVMRGDHEHYTGVLGIGVFLAIFLHKPLDAMSIAALMNAGGWDRGARWMINLLFAAMCPLGALLFYFGIDLLGEGRDQAVACALAFSAGAFICIALSDLLPEVHFHSHDRTKLTLAFLAGIALAYSLGGLEPAGLHAG